MREVKINIYKFDELSKEIQEKVLYKMLDINVYYEWWQCIYEDAKRIGLKIESFELDRGAYCKGKWIGGAEDAMEKILQEHGEPCETYTDALSFQNELGQAKKSFESKKDYDPEYKEFEESGEYEEICEEFLKALLEDYRIILQKEYDYLTSEKAIRDTIIANEYEFKENGRIWP